MQIKTIEGMAEAQPLSDIQEYNKRLGIQAKWLKALVVLGYIGFIYLVIMTGYILYTGAVNNALAAIGRC